MSRPCALCGAPVIPAAGEHDTEIIMLDAAPVASLYDLVPRPHAMPRAVVSPVMRAAQGRHQRHVCQRRKGAAA
jgi:hypothetical protein